MSTLRSENLETRYNQPAFVQLEKLQNNPYFSSKDIITITGFMKTEEEVISHLEAMKSLIFDAKH